MATLRYQISLLMLKKYFTRLLHSIISLSPSSHVMFYIKTNEIPNHFSLIFFCFKRHDLLSSHSNIVIVSCVKISCLSSSWYFIGVYVIK